MLGTSSFFQFLLCPKGQEGKELSPLGRGGGRGKWQMPTLLPELPGICLARKEGSRGLPTLTPCHFIPGPTPSGGDQPSSVPQRSCVVRLFSVEGSGLRLPLSTRLISLHLRVHPHKDRWHIRIPRAVITKFLWTTAVSGSYKVISSFLSVYEHSTYRGR